MPEYWINEVSDSFSDKTLFTGKLLFFLENMSLNTFFEYFFPEEDLLNCFQNSTDFTVDDTFKPIDNVLDLIEA